jgi:hypothetical protein
MISDKSSLASRLGWIINDVEQAIARARQSFAQYSESVDGSGLSACRETCRQIWGALDVLGAGGASMLSHELVQLLDALLHNKVENLQAAKEAMAEGLLQLSEYLKHLQEGYADLPVVVLPTLNNLRAARDEELMSEHLVFLPEEGHASNDALGTEEYVALTPERLQQVSTKLRFYFQKALLGWFRDEQPQRMLQAAGKVASNIVVLNHSRRMRALWWITSALTESLEHKRLEQSVAVKMLMGRMEREIRRFGEMGEAAYEPTVPDGLIKNLLYYIGLAESGSVITDKVKAAYKLDLYLPQGETLAELRQHYTTPGRDLWRAVATSVVDELKGLQGMLEAMQQDKERQVDLLPKLIEKGNSLASTLAMLGLGQAANLTQELGENLKAKAERAEHLDDDALLDVSTHYAKLEKVLEEYAVTGYDTTDSVFGEEGDLHDLSSERTLLRTTLVELAKAQSRTVDFYRKGWSFMDLEEVASALDNVSGAIMLMEANELLPMVTTAHRYVSEDLLAKQREPSLEELAVFADILTLLEAALSARLQGDDYLSLIPTGFEKLRKLDQFTTLDLLAGVDLEGAVAELETKKKVEPRLPPMLFQRLQNQNQSSALMR